MLEEALANFTGRCAFKFGSFQGSRSCFIGEFNGMQWREFLSPYAHGDRNSVPVMLFLPCNQAEAVTQLQDNRILG